MRLSRIQVLTIATTLSHIQFSSAQTAIEYSLNYQASANGINAIASRSLSSDADSNYQLSNKLEASIAGQIVAKIEQISKLAPVESTLRPVTYSFLQTGLSQESHAIDYNWDSLQAISTENDKSWLIELGENTYDELSHQFALRQQIRQGIQHERNLKFAVIDEDEIESHHYQTITKEIVTTPLGTFNSTKIELIQSASSIDKTLLWLADDWHSVLIRMERTTSSGLTIVLELSGGTVDGLSIEPLLN
ncbi:DUF3108 domain-containing protein [Gammaproteobacteria bacterium]|uniref:DUF3108 domain-containing protein n=1 Tax=OM182 bacterium MED-G28 TaxID=1986256 RepID=A0A2A5WG69_9GAMM|nr:DUF3108 domain-containing protein [Gammaproteobacteria bacterium]PDH35391.1 MAG: hypothetical protein CNF02_01385 [OM182 bacterium MED-G28]